MRWPKRGAWRRRRVFISLGIVVLIVVGGGGGGAFAYTTVKKQADQLQAQITAHLQSGQSELEAAKASLKTANNNHDENLINQAKAHFTAAKAQFSAARQIADKSQLLSRLEGVPVVGSQVRSRQIAVDGVADMGVAITDAGQVLADLDGQLIKPSAPGQGGRKLLTVLDLTSKSLVTVRADLNRAQRAAASVDLQVLPTGQRGTLVKAVGTIASALAAVDQFQGLVPVLREVLGGNGARNYLIEQVNPAELRPGGGFIGTYSVLRADQGTLKLIKSGDAYQLSNPRQLVGQTGYVAPPGLLLETLLKTTSWSFVDSNFFPDFPSNAKSAETFAKPRLGMNIDGVISIDYYTVAKMLELTGPMAVPGYRVTVNASNFIPLVIQDDLNATTHKALLSALAGPLLQRVANLPADRWPALISALNALSGTRHLQAYFNNHSLQQQMDLFGWSGTMTVARGQDYMMEVESNMGSTKANYFITRHYTVELTRKGGTLHHKVTVDIVDDMPYYYRPREFYQAYVRLYVGASASSRSDNLRAVLYPDPAAPTNTRLIDGWIPTFHGYGHSAQAVFAYDTPWNPDAGGQDQMYWQKQPGTLTDGVDVIWNDGAGHIFKVSGQLGQDLAISFSAKGAAIKAAHLGLATLPSLSLG